jgi:hypothetical protein
MATQGQLARIHIAKKELNLPDDRYRRILYRVAMKNSAKDCTEYEANRVLAYFRRCGWKPKPRSKKYDNLGHRPHMATPSQMRKIEVTWDKVSRATTVRTRHIALRNFLNRLVAVSDITFLTHDAAQKVLIALTTMEKEVQNRHPNSGT